MTQRSVIAKASSVCRISCLVSAALLTALMVVVPIPTGESATGDEGTWTTRGPNMGQVRALAISPTFTSDGLLVAGDEEMGVWRSEDGGVHWILTAEPEGGWDTGGQAIGALAFSSDYANDQEIFAASRCTIYRSQDKGNAWENIGPGGDCFAETIATSPNYANDRTLMMFPWSESTFYRSTNAGQTWEEIDLPYGACGQGFVFSPNYAQDYMLFTAGYCPHHNSGIFKSTDGGTTWTLVGDYGYIFSLAISPEYAQDGTIFAGSIDGIVYRSTDSGQTWTELDLDTSRQVQSLAVSPNFATDRTVFAGTYSDEVYRSTDAGETWESIVPNPRGAHAWAVSPNFATDRTVFFGANREYPPSGVYRSLDAGDSWEQVGLPMVSSYAIAVWQRSPDHTHVLAGTRSGVFKSQDGGETWSERLLSERTRSVAHSPGFDTDNTAFAGTERGLYRTGDGGDTWTRVGLRDTDIRAVMPSPSFADDGTVYAGTFGLGVWRSPDGGDTWFEANEGLVNHLTISLAVSPDFLSDRTLFAGTNGDGVFKSTDRGASWQSSSEGLLNQTVYDLGISPVFPTDQTLFSGTFRGVYRSTDNGGNWTRIGLESFPVYAIKVSDNYASDRTVYAGSPEAGVFESTDGGTTWQAINEGLWSQTVNALDARIDSQVELYAALDGAGVWRLVKAPSTPTARIYLPLLLKSR